MFHDSFRVLLAASMTGKAWCATLETAEKDLKNTQKQVLFRTKEVMKVLSSQDVENCLESTILWIMEHDTMALVKELMQLLPKAIATITEVVEHAQSNMYFFETFQEAHNKKEKEKRQAKVSLWCLTECSTSS